MTPKPCSSADAVMWVVLRTNTSSGFSPFERVLRSKFRPPISISASASPTVVLIVLRMDVLLERSSVSPKFEAT